MEGWKSCRIFNFLKPLTAPPGMTSQKYCAETYRVEKRSMEWMAKQVELGVVTGSQLSNFAKEDHRTMAVFIELWTATLLQKVLLGGLRVKLQQKVEVAAIEEEVLLAVGLIGSFLDAASNHQRERAAGDVVTRADVHQAARAMGLRCCSSSPTFGVRTPLTSMACPPRWSIGLPLSISSHLVTVCPGRSQQWQPRWSRPWEGTLGTTWTRGRSSRRAMLGTRAGGVC